MPWRAIKRGLIRRLLELLHLAVLVFIVWLVLQFFTPEELQAHALRFWDWWTGLAPVAYARYWDPVGAGIVLGLLLIFVLKRLLSRRRRGSYHGGGGGYDGDGGDGGGNGGD